LRAQRGPGVTANTHFCQPSFSIIDWPKPPYDGTACCSGNFIEVLAAPERASQSGRSSTLLYVLQSRVPHCSVGGSVPPIQHYLPNRHGVHLKVSSLGSVLNVREGIQRVYRGRRGGRRHGSDGQPPAEASRRELPTGCRRVAERAQLAALGRRLCALRSRVAKPPPVRPQPQPPSRRGSRWRLLTADRDRARRWYAYLEHQALFLDGVGRDGGRGGWGGRAALLLRRSPLLLLLARDLVHSPTALLQ
jgi:hypothetical protein